MRHDLNRTASGHIIDKIPKNARQRRKFKAARKKIQDIDEDKLIINKTPFLISSSKTQEDVD